MCIQGNSGCLHSSYSDIRNLKIMKWHGTSLCKLCSLLIPSLQLKSRGKFAVLQAKQIILLIKMTCIHAGTKYFQIIARQPAAFVQVAMEIVLQFSIMLWRQFNIISPWHNRIANMLYFHYSTELRLCGSFPLFYRTPIIWLKIFIEMFIHNETRNCKKEQDPINQCEPHSEAFIMLELQPKLFLANMPKLKSHVRLSEQL